MIRQLMILAALAVTGLAMPRGATAQTGPSVSPYLNLLNMDQFGNPGGIPGTYQTLVKPFIEQREASQANRADLNRLQSQVNGRGVGRAGAATGAGAGTGGSYLNHFQNYSHYYSGIRK